MTENKNNIPSIKPIALKEFDTKQSKYEMVPEDSLPLRYSWSIRLRKDNPATEHDSGHLPRLLLKDLYL
jgi:hypothetical protein